MTLQTDQRNHYNNIAQKYVVKRLERNTLAYRDELWNEFIGMFKRETSMGDGALCLDAMCGNAEASARLAATFENLNFEAFDYSDEMVNLAGSGPLARTGRLKLKRMDVMDLSEKDRYDAAVVIGGIHHVYRNAAAAVARIYAALKPGGLFMNFEPTNNFSVTGRIRERIYLGNSIFDPGNEHDFRLKDYNAILEGAGFSIKRQFYPGLLGYVLFYNPDVFPMLNKGTPWLARRLCRIDIALGKTFLGKKLSFNTFTIARKRDLPERFTPSDNKN